MRFLDNGAVDDDFGLQGAMDGAAVGDFHQASALSVIKFAKQFDRLVNTVNAAVLGFAVFAIHCAVEDCSRAGLKSGQVHR